MKIEKQQLVTICSGCFHNTTTEMYWHVPIVALFSTAHLSPPSLCFKSTAALSSDGDATLSRNPRKKEVLEFLLNAEK